MPLRLRAPLVVFAAVSIAGAAMACSSEPAGAPAEPAATAAPAAPAAPAEPAAADTPDAAGTAEEAAAASDAGSTKYVPPVRGTADIGYLAPKTTVKNNVVITAITVRNMSTGSIAGLKIEEYWWDKNSNPVTGDSVRLNKPLLPGETATLTLETPKDPKMFRNTYVFRHAFGQVKATLLPSLE